MASNSSTNKSAWVQLYEARLTNFEVQTRPPGRPHSTVPRKKVGVTLSQGEINELAEWKDRLTELVGRKISTGEVIGILARICSARYANLSESVEVKELADLVDAMIR